TVIMLPFNKIYTTFLTLPHYCTQSLDFSKKCVKIYGITSASKVSLDLYFYDLGENYIKSPY
ncbi:MAG: hypothetical protein ACUVQT_01460, partial [bacterium]